VNKHGAEHVINWELASTAEGRQLISKYKQIEPYMEPPFVVEVLAKAASPSSNGDEAANGEPSDTAEDGEEKVGKRQPRPLPSARSKLNSSRNQTLATSSTMCSMRAAKTSPSSVIKAWAK